MVEQGPCMQQPCHQRDQSESTVIEKNVEEWEKCFSWTHSEPLSAAPRHTEATSSFPLGPAEQRPERLAQHGGRP